MKNAGFYFLLKLAEKNGSVSIEREAINGDGTIFRITSAGVSLLGNSDQIEGQMMFLMNNKKEGSDVNSSL
jgi:hypothetical protein